LNAVQSSEVILLKAE